MKPTNLRNFAMASSIAIAAAIFVGPSAVAQDQEGDDALRDTISEPAIPEAIITDAAEENLVPPDPLPAAIFLRIEYDEGTLAGGNSDQRMLDLYEFYDGRLYQPVWVDANGPTDKAIAMSETLLRAERHGLVPEDYGAAFIATLSSARSENALAELEIRLSKALLDYGRDLSVGRVVPSEINSEIAVFPEGPSAAELLIGVIDAPDIREYLERMAPQTENYRRLRSTLGNYRTIAAQGGWSRVPDGEVLKPGASQARVAALARRLVEAGLLEPTEAPLGEIPLYEGAIVTAVETFQQRHGLVVDGVVGPGTLAALNVPIESRIASMELNLERRRWMKNDFGETYVFVNLADFELKVVKGEKTVHTARIVIGKPYHRTPVFSDMMTYMVINPYWHVPPSIARNELLPKLIANPGSLRADSIRVLDGWTENAREVDPYSVNWRAYQGRSFPFKLRQDPGNGNALGRIKFMFPNKFNVYLHDTPSKSLFSRTVRSFSHGCMRVQDPVDLASVLLADDPNWTAASIRSAIDGRRKRIVKLKSPIPVHVSYLTAWVNKDGSVHFRDDIYGRDKILAEALQRSRVPVN